MVRAKKRPKDDPASPKATPLLKTPAAKLKRIAKAETCPPFSPSHETRSKLKGRKFPPLQLESLGTPRKSRIPTNVGLDEIPSPLNLRLKDSPERLVEGSEDEEMKELKDELERLDLSEDEDSTPEEPSANSKKSNGHPRHLKNRKKTPARRKVSRRTIVVDTNTKDDMITETQEQSRTTRQTRTTRATSGANSKLAAAALHDLDNMSPLNLNPRIPFSTKGHPQQDSGSKNRSSAPTVPTPDIEHIRTQILDFTGRLAIAKERSLWAVVDYETIKELHFEIGSIDDEATREQMEQTLDVMQKFRSSGTVLRFILKRWMKSGLKCPSDVRGKKH